MNTKVIVTAIGVVLFLVAGFKMYVFGFYTSDLAWIIPLYVIGLVVIVVGRKMPANRR